MHDAAVLGGHGTAVVAVDDGLVEGEAREAFDAVFGIERLVGLVAEVVGFVDETADEGVIGGEELVETSVLEILGDTLLQLLDCLNSSDVCLVQESTLSSVFIELKGFEIKYD